MDEQIENLIKERKDYQAYYYRAVPADFVDYDIEQVKVMNRYASEVDDGI